MSVQVENKDAVSPAARRAMVVFGTRPEAIKLAPVVRALDASTDFEAVVAVTAQHRTILDQVLQLFEIVPAHDLDVIQPRQTLTDVTTRSLRGLMPVMEQRRPDVVLVQGDTTTTFAAALAGFYSGVDVAHVEAGLRTGDVRRPFPEEMNRRLTSQLARLHFAPTETARCALLREGIDGDNVFVTGNTVIDALSCVVGQNRPYENAVLRGLEADGRRVVLVTAHRRESWGRGMQAIAAALATVASARPDVLIVFPIHPNPLVRESIIPAVADLTNVLILEPLPYGDFARLMAHSTLILTDSGGVQEEGPSLGKPVLVMRDSTERPEAVTAGTAALVGTDPRRIVSSVSQLLDDASAYARMASAVNPYGDGHASSRILQALAHRFGLCERPAPFVPAKAA